MITRRWFLGTALAAALFVVANALTIVAVVAISSVYDLLWGPDPRRFGFWVNYGLDLTGMCVHLEIYLRRTFRGTTAELQRTVSEVLAGRAQAPAPDPNVEPGYGGA